MSHNSTNPNGPIAPNPAEDAQEPVVDGVEASEAAVIEDLKVQVEKFKNDFLYLRADFDNYRRNIVKERSDLTKFGCERLMVDLLGVVDNFERALETRLSPENFSNYAKGVEMTSVDLRNVLQKHGVTEVPSLGQPFDPNFHEALTTEVTTASPAGSVLRVLRKPYKLHDRVIRPGQVVVARQPDN